MKRINIVLLGYGRVGKAFIRLIRQKRDICLSRYKIDLRIGVVLNSKGGLFLPSGQQGNASLPDLASGLNLEDFPVWQPGLTLEEVLENSSFDILVDCTPSDIHDGEPALSFAHQALDRGCHLVTANKGPLVVDYNGLRQKAEKNGLSLGMSGAAAAALPTLDVALHSLAGSEIHRIEGILNGTTNHILTRMSGGEDYVTALREAQEKGIAEPDPSQDVEGWDTAAKILIITNAVFQTGFALKDVRVRGITHIPFELLEEARTGPRSLKLIGCFQKEGGGSKLETRLSLLEPSHPLYGVDGAQKGITFFTDTMDTVSVTGGKSDPVGAAAALLKDIINILIGQAI